ncbi:MAG: ATP-binding protein [Myxococcota bacterium]
MSSIGELEDELERLRSDNKALHEQVKLLVRTEHRLYRSQNQIDRQLARVRSLGDYVLDCPSVARPEEILIGVTELVARHFNVDRVQPYEVIARGDTMRLHAPPAVEVTVTAEDREALEALSGPWLGTNEPGQVFSALFAALDAADAQPEPHPETGDAALIPIRVMGRLAWVLAVRRFSRRPANRFQEVPNESHAPFFMLMAGHIERALENAELNHDLRIQAEELAESNRKLKDSLGDLASTQHQLIQASKMEALGRLAGGVAHDFNNLLTVIVGTARLMLHEDLTPSLREDCRTIIEAAERGTDLGRQMLTFGRRQSGEAQRIEVHPLLTDMSRLLRRIIGEDVSLELRLEARNDAVQADPAQVEQVLMNLVLNARDAMPHGGAIVVETGLARPGDQPDGPTMFCLTVSDTGRGMDSKTQARVFEPFFTTKDVGEGSGMGLATVYGIVQQLEGHVQLESEPGEGSRFEVYLPLAGQPVVEEPVPSGAVARPTVLVVEDEAAIRRLVVRILGRQGYEVLAASDGESGLRRFVERGDIDLVLTDIVMPGLDGVGLVRLLRRRRPELPIVFMSGYSGDHRRGIGVADRKRMLDKPFTPEQLVERIDEALRTSV